LIYALSGGNDVLLFPDVPLALDAFRKAYQDSLFTDSRLASSVKKILNSIYAGLMCKPIEIINLYKDLNSTKNEALNYELMRTLLLF
jgi:hypothetical protein